MNFFNQKCDGNEFINKYDCAKYFSCGEDYAIEAIPKNIGFFKRKKWIQEKLNFIGNEKALVFVKNSKIMWAFLNDEQKYWLPFEKSQFFLSFVNEKVNDVLITEEKNGEFFYYGISDGFLVAFTKNYDEALMNIRKFSEKNGRIFNLGIGKVEKICDKILSFDEISKSVKNVCKNNCEIELQDEDDLIFLNEDVDFYGDSKQKNFSLDEIFFQWFSNKTNDSKLEKFGTKRITILASMAAFMLVFFFGGLYYQSEKNQKISEINTTLEKLYKLGK